MKSADIEIFQYLCYRQACQGQRDILVAKNSKDLGGIFIDGPFKFVAARRNPPFACFDIFPVPT